VGASFLANSSENKILAGPLTRFFRFWANLTPIVICVICEICGYYSFRARRRNRGQFTTARFPAMAAVCADLDQRLGFGGLFAWPNHFVP
jgi:hypothetical protein